MGERLLPSGAGRPSIRCPAKTPLQQQLIEVEARLEALRETKDELKQKLQLESLPRRLLYEKGKPLEAAIIQALQLMGFSAKPYRDHQSEFDVVFESKEGRLIGEAEGKDNRPINIDKLRQLEMNIHEDFEGEEVSEMAKGALFGNAFRLTPPPERKGFFTDKCMTAARRSSTALVKTTELFAVVQYLSKKSDAAFARRCRKAILDSEGTVVAFPSTPSATPRRRKTKKA